MKPNRSLKTVFLAAGILVGVITIVAILLDLADFQSLPLTQSEPAARQSSRISTVRTVVFAVAGFLNLGVLAWAFRRISSEIRRREAVELELDESEERTTHDRARYAAIVESSDDAIITKNLDGIITSWNAGAERVFGYSAGEAVGKSMLMLFPPECVHEEPGIIERLKRGEIVHHFETVRIRKGGTPVDVSVTISPLRDSRGSVVGASKIARDITGRKRAEEALRQSEERFRALVTATSDVVYRMSPDWTEMWHLRGRDFIADTDAPSGTWLQRYIHTKDHPLVLATIHEAIRTRSIFALEHQVLRVDGSLGWTFSRAVPLLDDHGEVKEWFGAASDITARKEAEQKIRAQLARLDLLSRTTRAIGERQDLKSILQVVARSLEDNLPVDFACVCHYDGAENLLTVACVGAKSAPLAMDLSMPEHTRIPIDQNGLSRCVRGELVYEPDLGVANFPFPRRLFRGGLNAMVIAPLVVESGVCGVFVAGRRQARSFSSADCEFLRQLSEHVGLAAHQAQLYEALQRAYEDLRQTQQAVMQQERLKALGQMASGIAHDINNAISPVALYTELLLEKEPGLSAHARDYLATIQRAIEDVAHTVGRMREFYRKGEPQLALAPVKLNALAQQVIDLTRARWSDMPQQRGVHVQIRTELDVVLPTVRGVESELREALVNLVFNAVDAMPDGGTLTFRTGYSRTERWVRVEVTDTGIGMDEDTRRRCLEPFFTTKGERGTGLGLAMVYGIVQRHGGEIEIESAPGKGTTMRLLLPAEPGTAGVPDKAGAPVLVPRRLRLLVVDDDPLLIKSLRDILETDGHVVVTANAGQDGIDAFRKAHERNELFAAVITDLGMPYVDGRQVAAAVKNVSPSTPVILLTGWGQRLAAEGNALPHVDRLLNKPPKLHDLRDALARCSQPGFSSM